MTATDIGQVEAAAAAFREDYTRAKEQIQLAIVGHEEIIDGVLTCLFADGHALLEGVPGLGKTLLIRSLAQALHLTFSRIQFTPDLMPADITGTSVVVEEPGTGRRSFSFRPGPIFSQLLLADEINRATPKSQSALLEAMQERSVTVAGKTRQLTRPFLVLATQNPIEQEGTYPLPEAQLDRFFFKIAVPFVNRVELNKIIARTTSGGATAVTPVMDGAYIIKAQQLARRIVVAPHVQDYTIRLVLATHPGTGAGDETDRYVRVGVSPRGAQALICAAKVRALLAGRYAVAFKDIDSVARPALRHRIIRSFEAEAEGVTTDDIIERLLETVPRDVE